MSIDDSVISASARARARREGYLFVTDRWTGRVVLVDAETNSVVDADCTAAELTERFGRRPLVRPRV